VKDFYERFYRAVATSLANAVYCEELYGRNLCQHGFADLAQLDALIQESALGPGLCALDLGCGNGLITEYLLTLSQADYLYGIDYIPEAIRQAQALAAARPGRLNFSVMDIANITLRPASFDMVVAVDTLYFTPLAETLPQLLKLLHPGGRLAAFWSESCNPSMDLETFDREKVKMDQTELAQELKKLGLAYRAWDFTDADADHARRKEQIAEHLRPQFEAEGNLFLYENHMGEALGVQRACNAGAHGRYLYTATVV
jgi:SAM-dependent methyltransferase